MLAPGALERAAEVMEADADISFVYGPGRLFSTQPPQPGPLGAESGWRKQRGLDWIDRVCRVGENLMISPEVLVRTSAQRQVGSYDPMLPHSGDLEMWLRLAQVGDVGELLGGTQAYIRQHGNSMRHTVFADPMNSLEQRRRAFEFALARLESNGVDCSPMMRAVNGAVAPGCFVVHHPDALAPAVRCRKRASPARVLRADGRRRVAGERPAPSGTHSCGRLSSTAYAGGREAG